MRRFLAFIFLFASVAATATAAAQSLGEVAERTKKERKGQGGKVYTNDDLGEEHPASQPAAAASTTEAPKPALTMEPAQRWRRDAKLARDAITRAETRVATLQARLDALLIDRNPTNVGDPNRLQTLEDLNGGCAISVVGLRNWVFSHGFFSGSASLRGRYWVTAGLLRGRCMRLFETP